MRTIFSLAFALIVVLNATGATNTISSLTLSTAPSTNTFIEIADMNAAVKSKKYLLTNLVSGWTASGADSTLAGIATVGGLKPVRKVTTHAGTVTLDFSTNTVNKLVLTGAVTLAFSNLATNRNYDLLIANAQTTNCAYVFPAVIPMGYYPTNIVAGKYARWWFEVDPQTNSIVYATYVEQQ